MMLFQARWENGSYESNSVWVTNFCSIWKSTHAPRRKGICVSHQLGNSNSRPERNCRTFYLSLHIWIPKYFWSHSSQSKFGFVVVFAISYMSGVQIAPRTNLTISRLFSCLNCATISTLVRINRRIKSIQGNHGAIAPDPAFPDFELHHSLFCHLPFTAPPQCESDRGRRHKEKHLGQLSGADIAEAQSRDSSLESDWELWCGGG